MYRLIYILTLLLIVSGCSTYGEIRNDPVTRITAAKPYSMESFHKKFSDGDSFIILAFSGGGTRAAALAYGVLQELRDTSFTTNKGEQKRLLDEVDIISSVSGGSFTAAYYGLFGDKLFEDFETAFLHHHIEKQVLKRFLNPFFIISPQGRTEAAIQYYQNTIFKYSTFGDMMHPDAPMIIINASDLGYGVRFSFTQEYFNLLCSDLASFPVARAVTASSAVPILFNPVVIKNHDKCGRKLPHILQTMRNKAQKDSELQMIMKGVSTYYNKDRRKYVHFVDGGITDNLGLRSIYDMLAVAGGAKSLMRRLKLGAPKRIAIISIDASTNPRLLMDATSRRPSLSETVGAMSNVQLHRYNVATVELLKSKLQDWAEQLSTPQSHVTPYFIKFGFKDLKSDKEKKFFNTIPTSFSLSEEQVNRLIKVGRELIRGNENYQRLLLDIKAKK